MFRVSVVVTLSFALWGPGCGSKASGSESETADGSSSDGPTSSGDETGASAVGAVGSPCNHGTVTPPEATPFATFPALSCNDLLCVFAEDIIVPEAPCTTDTDCNVTGAGMFACSPSGACEISLDYLLERSMCSRPCTSDADCNDDGDTNVVDPDTNCENGFKCSVLTGEGEACCQKLCICNDDPLNVGALEESCLELDPATGEPAICQ